MRRVEELEDDEHLLNLGAVQVVTLHRVLEIHLHRLQQKSHRLVHSHLREFVVYLLDLTSDAVERYHIARSTRSDEVSLDNLYVGESREHVMIGAEAENKVTLTYGIIATLLRGDLEVTRQEEE